MRTYTTLLLILVLVSCHPKKKQKEALLIPEDKFVKILVDYHMAEAVQASTLFINKTKTINSINLCDTLLKKYRYNRAILDSTISYYSADPEKFDMLYEKVITELNKRQAKLQGNQKPKPTGKGTEAKTPLEQKPVTKPVKAPR
jgi:hypothetical protein